MIDRITSPAEKPAVLRYGIALGLVLFAALGHVVLEDYLHDVEPYITFLVATGAVAWLAGLCPALLSAALGVVAAELFFAPKHLIPSQVTEAVVARFLYGGMAVAIAFFANAMHKARKQVLARQAELEREVCERRRSEEEREKQRARLAALAQTTEQILAATTAEGLLQRMVEAARKVVGVHRAECGLISRDGQFEMCPATGSDDNLLTVERGQILLQLLEGVPVLRLTELELKGQAAQQETSEAFREPRGVLGARLIGAQAQSVGLILLSAKREGEFTAEDEALLGQLAAVASLALQHVQARLEAVREKSRLEAFMENLPVGMAIIDANGCCVRANRAYEAIWGGPRTTTRSLEDYAAFRAWWANSGLPVQPEEWASAQVVKLGVPVLGQLLELEALNGERRFVLNSAAPVWDTAGQSAGCVVALQDISGLRRAEERIEQLYEEAQQEITHRKQVETELRRSNQDLSQFAFVISHDLRSPLNAVTSFARQLKEEYDSQLGTSADTYLNYLLGGTDRMRRLITDLLTYSRVAEGQCDAAAPASSQEALRLAQLNLEVKLRESNAEITYDPMPDVTANAGLLTQVFQNLLENAVKFRSEATPRIHVSAVRGEGGWVFSVSDNGIGIEPQYAEQVFRLFRRLQGDQFEGTGIGLAICRKIIERHGGRMWVESRLGEGAKFCFTLPGDEAITRTAAVS